MPKDIDLDLDHDLSEGEDIQEFKASMGDPSEVPGPSTKKTDEKPKGAKDPMPKPASKAGMMNAMVKKMNDMKKEDIEMAYANMFSEEMDDEDEDEDDDENYDDEDDKKSKKSSKKNMKFSKEDLDLSEDVKAMLNGTDLTEEAQERITTIFEAAVVSKVNEIIEDIAIETESDIEVSSLELEEELVTKLDSYLDYVVEEWMVDNEIAINSGLKNEMVEDFLSGLKDLFVEHYIDIPEEQVDVVEELVSKVDELESALNEETSKNISLNQTVKTYEKERIFNEQTQDLSDVQVEKLKDLSEGIDYSSKTDFVKKINTLKENYFNIKTTNSDVNIGDDSKNPVSLDEEADMNVSPSMAAYASAISKSVRK